MSTIDQTVSRRGKDKQDRINLGLDLAARHAKPKQPMSASEIAAWCGCSKQRISAIEASAMKKLRYKLHPNSPLFEELKAYL